jgi:putative membrane protein
MPEKSPLPVTAEADAKVRDRRIREDHESAKVERAEIRRATGTLADDADRRTQLAADRTMFAAERTYAAWVRTGLAALASGVGAKALLTGIIAPGAVLFAGTVLTLFSAFCFFAAVWRELFPGAPPPWPDARRLPGAVLYVVNFCLAAIAVLALASIWFNR